jgi:general nucleoside transport system permease protein
MDVVISLGTLSAGLRLALPVALAALGALLCERSGVLNLGLEGLMLSGALTGYLVTVSTGSPWLGLACGLLVGALCGALLGGAVVYLAANQIVAGLAFSLLAISATTYIYQSAYAIGQSPPRIPRIGMPPLVILTLVVLGLVVVYLRTTLSGLVLTASGESPVAGTRCRGIASGPWWRVRRWRRWAARCWCADHSDCSSRT